MQFTDIVRTEKKHEEETEICVLLMTMIKLLYIIYIVAYLQLHDV